MVWPAIACSGPAFPLAFPNQQSPRPTSGDAALRCAALLSTSLHLDSVSLRMKAKTGYNPTTSQLSPALPPPPPLHRPQPHLTSPHLTVLTSRLPPTSYTWPSDPNRPHSSSSPAAQLRVTKLLPATTHSSIPAQQTSQHLFFDRPLYLHLLELDGPSDLLSPRFSFSASTVQSEHGDEESYLRLPVPSSAHHHRMISTPRFGLSDDSL